MNPKSKFARVKCDEHGWQYLSEDQYDRQLDDPNKGWRCPVCNCYPCEWDDEYFERNIDEEELK